MQLEHFGLVEVPFLRKKTTAIVIELKNSSKFASKEIIRKLSDGAVITSSQASLSEKIAYEFLSNPSKALFSFLPDLNLKDLKTISALVKPTKPKKFKIQFIEAIFSQRIQFYLESLSKDSQDLIILPEISIIEEVEKKIRILDPSKEIYIWHSGISNHDKARIWKKIISGIPCTIIASRHGLFLPFTKLKTICLDRPFSFGYFEDQDPRYNAYQASKIAQKNYQCNLIFGDSICPPSIFVQVRKGMISQIKSTNKLNIYKAPELPNSLSSEMLFKTTHKSRNILVTGFFNNFVRVICADCKNQLCCHGCENDIFSDEDGSCLNCKKQPKAICPNCSSALFKKSGLSLTKIKQEVEKLFESVTDKPLGKHNITVCPIKDLNTLQPIYDLAIFPYIDQYNNYPIVNIKVELMRSIREMPTLGVSKVFLLTKNNNLFADQIASQKWDEIILQELNLRKKEGVPPFTRFFEILAEQKKLEAVDKIIPDLLFKSDGQKYAAFIPHKLVPNLQAYFANETPNLKARLDSPDF